jgi:hypothetical protein
VAPWTLTTFNFQDPPRTASADVTFVRVIERAHELPQYGVRFSLGKRESVRKRAACKDGCLLIQRGIIIYPQ